MLKGKMVIRDINPNRVPTMQRCRRCLSKGDFSLKEAYLVSSSDPARHNKYYCEPCFCKITGESNIKPIKLNTKMKPVDISESHLSFIPVRRDRISSIVQHNPGISVNEIAQIYDDLYSPQINSSVMRNDLLFLAQNLFIERRKLVTESIYRYYPIQTSKSA